MHESSKSRFFDRATPPHIFTLVSLAGLSALAMNIFLPSLGGMTEYFETEYAFMQLSVALYLAINGSCSSSSGRSRTNTDGAA